MGISHHAPQFCSFPSTPISILHLLAFPQRKFKKLKPNQPNKQKNLFHPPSFPPSNSSSFVLVALGATVCHTVYPLVQSALCTDVHCNKSLVWFKASSFYYTIITGPLPKLQVTDWVDVMGGNPRLRMYVWVAAELQCPEREKTSERQEMKELLFCFCRTSK